MGSTRPFDICGLNNIVRRRLSRTPSGSAPRIQKAVSRGTTQSHPTGGEATESVISIDLSLETGAHVGVQAATPVRAILSQKPRRTKPKPREGFYGPPQAPVGKMFENRYDWYGILGTTWMLIFDLSGWSAQGRESIIPLSQGYLFLQTIRRKMLTLGLIPLLSMVVTKTT